MDDLQTALNENFFRLSIYFASQGLYEQLKLKAFNVEKISEGMRQSLLRYYNRMCYRPTPFGIFSSFAYTTWGEGKTGLELDGREKLHLQTDFRLSLAIVNEVDPEEEPVTIYSNQSTYLVGKEMRYLKAGLSENIPEQVQGIAAIGKTNFLMELVELSKDGISWPELSDFFEENYPEENGKELLNELKLEELLFTFLMPNITGENYLKRAGNILRNQMITTWINKLSAFNNCREVTVRDMELSVQNFSSDAENIRNPFYVNYEKEVRGMVNKEYQEKISQGLYCLYRMHQESDAVAIARFKKKFIERFEEQEIQLMYALDPEAGIGYEQLEEPANSGELLDGILFKKVQAAQKIPWGPVQEMLLRKIYYSGETGKITITDQDVEGLPESMMPLSPGISVLFRIYKEKVFIESAGGATSTSLIGRFTPFNSELLKQTRNLAQAEQDANPGVIFAEIAHYSEEHAANINTREHIRKYEIPVLVHSTLPNEQIIHLNDLYVSVKNGEVILRSERLNQRIVPRLSTAYNHTRSELPVFRFLSDLQYQGIISTFSIRPDKLLPGLTYYPRIEYKECILSEALWVLEKEELNKITDAEGLSKVVTKRNISRYITIGNADRQLVFNTEDPKSIGMLFSELRDMESAMLREFFIPDSGNVLLKDKSGKVYVHQLVATLVNSVRSYFPLASKPAVKKHTDRYFLPGSEWIYFKIYCSQGNANYILEEKIYPILKKSIKYPDKWFFIRYYDPEHHLRVRIRGSNEIIKELPGLFNKLLKPVIKSGLISKLQIDTYVREVERYGVNTIDQTEQVFCSSSDLVADHLREEMDEVNNIQFAMIGADEIFNSFSFELTDRVQLLENICKSLMLELGVEKQLRNDLNKKYREYQQNIQRFMDKTQKFLSYRKRTKMLVFKNDLKALSKQLHRLDPLRKDQSVADILHMHMNRVFSSDQRKKELVIYYFCLRFYISLRARTVSGLA